MARRYKLKVKRLPRTVCISIRTTKGRTLAKKKYVRRGRRRKAARRTTRRRKLKRPKIGKVAACVKRSNRSNLVCTRLARAGCLTKKGTLKKKKICRSMARNRGLKLKTHKRRRKSSALGKSGLFFGQTFKTLGDLVAP